MIRNDFLKHRRSVNGFIWTLVFLFEAKLRHLPSDVLCWVCLLWQHNALQSLLHHLEVDWNSLNMCRPICITVTGIIVAYGRLKRSIFEIIVQSFKMIPRHIEKGGLFRQTSVCAEASFSSALKQKELGLYYLRWPPPLHHPFTFPLNLSLKSQ